MTLALSIATFLAAIGLTYLCCVRPHLRGRSGCAAPTDAAAEAAEPETASRATTASVASPAAPSPAATGISNATG